MSWGETLVTAPAPLAVEFDEVVEHLMLDPDEAADIALDLENAIREATDYVEGQTHRALLSQTWDLVLEGFPRCEIRLPRWPVQSVVSLSYIDEAGDSQVLDPSLYQVDVASMPARVRPAYETSWPATRCDTYGAVRIRYVAGHGDTEASVPRAAKTYVKWKVEDLWRVRGTIEVGRRAMSVPGAEDRIRAQLMVPNL